MDIRISPNTIPKPSSPCHSLSEKAKATEIGFHQLGRSCLRSVAWPQGWGSPGRGRGRSPGDGGFGGLGGLVPAGLGMMGVPGGPPPPGGPCGETKLGSAMQTRASPTTPRFQTPPRAGPGTPKPSLAPSPHPGTDPPPQNHTSSPSRNVSAPRRQDGQMEQEDSPRMYQVMKKSMGSNREKRARFSCGAQPRAPATPPARPGWGSQGPPAPAAARRPRESRTGAGLRL